MILKKRILKLLSMTLLTASISTPVMCASDNTILTEVMLVDEGTRFMEVTTASGLQIGLKDTWQGMQEVFYVSLENAEWDDLTRTAMVNALCDPIDGIATHNTNYYIKANSIIKSQSSTDIIGELLFYDNKTVRVKLYEDIDLNLRDTNTVLQIPLLVTVIEGEAKVTLQTKGSSSTITDGSWVFASCSKSVVHINSKNIPSIYQEGNIAAIELVEGFKNCIRSNEVSIYVDLMSNEFVFDEVVDPNVELLNGFLGEEVIVGKQIDNDGSRLKITVQNLSLFNRDSIGRMLLDNIKIKSIVDMHADGDLYANIQVIDKEGIVYADENVRIAELDNRRSVEFSDIRLKYALIDKGVDKDNNNEISISEMRTLKSINLSNYGISDLSGLEYAYNLESLWLSNNQLQDIKILGEMDTIKLLDLSNNNIKDISCLIEKEYDLLDIRNNYLDIAIGSGTRNKIDKLVELGSRVSIEPQKSIINDSSQDSSDDDSKEDTSSDDDINSKEDVSSNNGSINSNDNNSVLLNEIQHVIEKITDSEKNKIYQNISNKCPYTSMELPLTIEQLDQATGNKFNIKQLQEIVKSPDLLRKLGIDIEALYTEVILIPIEDAHLTDIKEEHWAYETIKQAAELGLIKGTPEGKFNPNEELKVEDTCSFLDRILLLNKITDMKLTRDIVEKYINNKNHWAFNSVASVGSKLSEMSLSTISKIGNESLSREVLAQVLFEITDGRLPAIKEKGTFKDVQSSPYQDAIDYCSMTGLLNGINNHEMAPQKALTRAELMTVLVRLNNVLKEK